MLCCIMTSYSFFFFFFQAEDGIRDVAVTGVQTCALPIYIVRRRKLHLLEDRQGDGQVLLLHALTAARFRPAVELLAQNLAGFWFCHSHFPGIRQLHRPVAGRTEMCAVRRQPAALAAEPAGTYQNGSHPGVPLLSAGPNRSEERRVGEEC